MNTIAAILVETDQPLELVSLEIPPLNPGQVLVKILYSGVCHTQILETRGFRGFDKFLPHCLGHEGSGIVLEIGENVTKVKQGDRVILSWIQGSGINVPGTIYNWDGKKCNSGAITTFSQYSVISENRLTPIHMGIRDEEAAMIGCAIPTGVGSVLNTGDAKQGNSIAVFGAGGIGSMSINAAKAFGCDPIIAIDIRDYKLKCAKEFGATHTINSSKTDPINEINRIIRGGVDLAVEATGRPEIMTSALRSVRNQGGVAVIVGNAHSGDVISIDPGQLNNGKQLRGTWGGDCVPDRDYPLFMKMIRDNDIYPDLLLSDIYPLEKINDAIDDLEAGKVVRPIIKMDHSDS